jgi:thioredoxin reductase (NADPH)
MVDSLYDVVIVGSGPAGLTAATYASRAGLQTLVVGGVTWGGQLMLTSEVENFPGFPDGILGPDLMGKMRRQAERFGAEFLFEDVTSVDFSSHPFKVNVGDKNLEAKTVIIATGALTKLLGLDAERRLMGRGVSVCATCDAPFFRDRKVVVVGGGDTAMEEALALAKYAQEVTIVHRRDQLRACKILQRRVFANKKIKIMWNSVVEDILGDDRVKGVKLKNVQTAEVTTFPCDGVFIAIGYKPNTDLFKDKIDLDENGYVIVHDETKTSVEGVFAAGDNQDRKYKQAITSAGAGCKAALDAEKYLQENSI